MKKLYFIALLLLAATVAYSQQTRVMINTLKGDISKVPDNSVREYLLPQIHTEAELNPEAIQPIKTKASSLFYDIQASQRVFIFTLKDTSDSAFIYPPNPNFQDPNEIWTFTGFYDYPFSLGSWGNAYGFGQFHPALPGKLTIDTIALDLFKLLVRPDLTSDFWLYPISLPSININDTSSWNGFRFDLNNVDYQELGDQIKIPKDTINSRLKDIGGGQVQRYRVILKLPKPIVIEAGNNFGFLMFSAGSNPLRDSVRMLGGFEWQLPRKETYATIIRKNGLSDTVESTFLWYRTWQPPYDQKFKPLNGQYVRQNFSMILVGTYEGELSVRANSYEAQPFTLNQNTPNPVFNSTNIDFALENSGDVSLKVYNSMGQEVAVLVNNYMIPGSYTVPFDVTNLPSGAYFYTLKSGIHSITKTMQIVK
ncbi:MAG: T9SS type A sorting domain-containing protein [Candidatus Kapabacteria bacterium]|nr:T9SS type A sorting domain-containing protein [Candidatus Kapabacteria bacterium]